MLAPAVDYARAIAYLDLRKLPAYVSYVERGNAWGMKSAHQTSATIYVRTRDGVVVSGPPTQPQTTTYDDKRNSNPISRPAFDPACYRVRSESRASWQGAAALRFSLAPICKGDTSDYPFRALYVSAASLRPLEVEGSVNESGVGVSLAERFARVDTYTLPTQLTADVAGHGLLFWVHEHARAEYLDYRFYSVKPIIRKQSQTSPAP